MQSGKEQELSQVLWSPRKEGWLKGSPVNKKQAQARAGPASVPSIGSRKYLQGPGSQLGPVW